MGNTSVFVGERLLEAEAENGLFDLKVNDIYLWQYVRYICLAKILEEITGVETICRDISAIQDRKEGLKWKGCLKRQQFLAHKKDILVLNHPGRVKEGKYYKCRVTDTILDHLEYSYYVYEREYFGLHYTPVQTRDLKYIDVDIIKKVIKYDEEQNKKQLSVFVKKIICTFENYCQIVMSKGMKQFICSYVFSAYKDLFYDRIWAKIVLTLVRPKLVIETVGYNPFVQTVVALSLIHI